MKVYVKATNIADIQAKIAKKQADIDKKYAWIEKKEASIQKRLAKLSKIVDAGELTRIESHVEYLKDHDDWQLPPEYDTVDIDRKYWKDDTARETLYGIDTDAQSIYTSRKAIKDLQRTLEEYKAKLGAEKAKDSVIDEIPECLKEFMQSLIEEWDEYDIQLRDASKPFYRDLRKKADDIIYPDGNRSLKDSDDILRDMYPHMADRKSWDIRNQFEWEYIYAPFLGEFGVSKEYAARFWGMTDEQIHNDNVKSAKQIILDLLKRVTKVTGPVVDWSNLNVTAGNGGFAVLNGIVIGEEGKARVESITASGPIQRLHIRTLVKPIK